MKNDILKTFKNSEIFDIFKNNKRLLLFLFEEQIITVDEDIVLQITSEDFQENKYCEYFSPEIKPFITEEFIEKHSDGNLSDKKLIKEIMKERQEDFYEKRKKGENDNFVCQLIRRKQTKEFIVYVNKTNLPLDSDIEESIFETNEILMEYIEGIKIIEYAAFYGSNEIIRYMHMNGASLTSNMWYYAIHQISRRQ